MPIYGYRCKKSHEFEVMQSMTDESVTKCPECGAAVERVFHPIAVHFKGSGFYSTDYGRGGRSGSSTDSKESSDSKDGSDSKDSSDSKGGEKEKAGSKAESSSGSKSDSGNGKTASGKSESSSGSSKSSE